MDEKEKIDIEKRAEKYGKLEYNYEWDLIRTSAYVQGALDQDPISRKAEREEIIQILEDKQDQHLEFESPVYKAIQECLKAIAALP